LTHGVEFLTGGFAYELLAARGDAGKEETLVRCRVLA
jgi:hypothetical protein